MKTSAALSTFKKLGLTRREADVLLWIARGQSNSEIGTILCISPRTVKKHLERVFRKLAVKTRLEAAVRAGEACSARSRTSARKTLTRHALSPIRRNRRLISGTESRS
jgi:DNA-binding CsgD family transcriptional regulator